MKERWKEMLEYEQKVQAERTRDFVWRSLGGHEDGPVIEATAVRVVRALKGEDAMTDLELARLTYGIIRDFGWDVLWKSSNPIPDDAWPIDIIANALAAARREGAERERDAAYWRGLEAGKCAALVDRQIGKAEGAEEMRERVTSDATRENLVRVIRRYFGAYDQANGVPEEVANRVLECFAALPLTPEEPK